MLHLAACLLVPLAAAPAPLQEDGADVAAATAELPDPAEWYREFAERHPRSRYRILRKDREVGTYFQRTRVARVQGREAVEFTDRLEAVGMAGYDTQVVHELRDGGITPRMFQAKTSIDGLRLAFDEGRAKGQALMQRPVDLEVPERFITDIDLLRGLPRVAREKGAEAELAFLDIEALPSPDSVTTGTLRCLGQETVELDGGTRTAWKYRWKPEGQRPTFLWYEDDGRLLRRERRKEVWELDLRKGRDGDEDAED